MIKLDSFHGHKEGLTYANQSMWYITLTKGKTKTTWSSQKMWRKTFDKIQHSFMIKNSHQHEYRELNIINSEHPTHWKRPWCWERLREEGEEGIRGWNGWMHHQCNGHELGHTSGDGEGQRGLACCSARGCKELDTTGWITLPVWGLSWWLRR